VAAGRKTLPVLYALAVSSPAAQSQLRQLLDLAPRDVGAARRARQMLADQGALHALVFEAEVRRQQATSALLGVGADSPAKDQLLELVDQAIAWLDRGRTDACSSGG
jgi:geranylgeranyl pyrophosphate synthase